ncbi:hypothetical protein [Salinisphaera sp. Q1T1-3]|uniref:hypothetical protein n=1 Tax=Salinisphaera sp. Q1T1-3 TaxID=2321229 RepID=UPI0018F3D39B|nr:hypothetical protein [Salinisphaera sp. Q1T1-3]
MLPKNKMIASATVVALALGSNAAFAASETADNSATTQTKTTAGSQSQSQGLYSADQLMDASVYTTSDNKKAIGEIDDVLLGNDMSIQKFVIETDGKFGLGAGKSFVVSPSDLTVETLKSKHESKPEYRVTLNLTSEQLSQQPVYSDSWWSNAQSQASDAWQNTKNSAQSAWTQLKSTTSNIMSGAQDQADDAQDATSNAADNAQDATSNAADEASDTAGNAADSTADSASDAADAAQDKASNAADEASDKADQATDNN